MKAELGTGFCKTCFMKVLTYQENNSYYVYCRNGCFINEFILSGHIQVDTGIVKKVY